MECTGILKTKCGCERTISLQKIYASVVVALVTENRDRVFMWSCQVDEHTAIYVELWDSLNSYPTAKTGDIIGSDAYINPYLKRE